VRHDLRLEGRAFRLRPVEPKDAGFIAALRRDPRAAGRLHPVSGLVDDQVAWIQAYLGRAEDWYWIVESRRSDLPEGTLGLWRADDVPGRAQWGRWVLRAGSLAAPESALLLYRAAFEELGLRAVYCRTVAANRAVVSFHDRAGLDRAGVVTGAFQFGATPIDAVEHELTRDGWPATRAILEASAAAVALLIDREAGR